MTVESRRAFVARAVGLGASAIGLAVVNGCGVVLGNRARPTEGPPGGLRLRRPSGSPWITALWDGLRELGWIDGVNFMIEARSSLAQSELGAHVAELIALPVDVLVTVGTPVTLEAKQATETIPIVFAPARDPVGVGIVASLARPGGNVTGVSQGASTSLSGKRLEFLNAVVPGLAHAALIFDTINPGSERTYIGGIPAGGRRARGPGAGVLCQRRRRSGQSLRDSRGLASSGCDRGAERAVPRGARPPCGPRGWPSPTRDVPGSGVRLLSRTHGIWDEQHKTAPSRGHICRQDPPGGRPGQSSRSNN